MQCNCYFVKMAFSQWNLYSVVRQFEVTSELIYGTTMNEKPKMPMWSELYPENSQRHWQIISAVVGIHYYTFTDDHLLTFTPNKRSRMFMWRKDYEQWCICAQHFSGFNHQFVSSLTSNPLASFCCMTLVLEVIEEMQLQSECDCTIVTGLYYETVVL